MGGGTRNAKLSIQYLFLLLFSFGDFTVPDTDFESSGKPLKVSETRNETEFKF